MVLRKEFRHKQRSIRKLHPPRYSRCSSLTSRTLNPNWKVTGKANKRWIFKNYCPCIIGHLGTSVCPENDWFSISRNIHIRISPIEVFYFSIAFGTRSFFNRKRSTWFASAVWIADRSLLKWKWLSSALTDRADFRRKDVNAPVILYGSEFLEKHARCKGLFQFLIYIHKFNIYLFFNYYAGYWGCKMFNK